MNKSKLKQIGELFVTFAKIGAFTFGGGYAMIPLIETEIVTNKKWISQDEMLDMIAIAEATPGVLAVNCATFVGCRVGGFWGALCATIGVVLPSFIIILIVSIFLMQFRENIWVAYAFTGIRAAVVVLMVGAVKKLSKAYPKTIINVLLTGSAFLLASFTSVEIVLLIIAGALIGVVYQKIKEKIKPEI
ncbi:MAG: chromate transporter [Oscillospiraceae bacterium]